MTRRLHWSWWVAVLLAVIMLAGMAVSFAWVFAWTDSGGRYYLYLEHGMLCGNPNVLPPGTGPLPWYGHFEVYTSYVYTPWALLPEVDFSPPLPYVRFPIHLFLAILVMIVIYPLTPFAVRRDRRKRGLCVRCGYNLTGNTSGTCPECGQPI